MTSKVAVLGAGAWGTALAALLAERGEGPISLWSRRRELSDAVNESSENARYLPGIALPENLSCTDDLEAAIDESTMIVFVVPSHAMREVARAAAPHVVRGVPIVSATKGMETDSLMFMEEVLAQELPRHARDQLAFLSGPSFARELAMHLPTAVVIAAHHADLGAAVMKRFHTPYFRTYASADVAGVECGGALKNVVAIAAGAVDGFGLGHNTRAALITRGLAEIAKLAMARGGSALTLAGLAGLGDLVLTCTGDLSRNRTVGYEMGRGRTLDDVLSGLGHVAEGIRTAKSAHELSKKLGVDMPITSEVHSVLYEDKPVPQAVRDLMGRELGYEFDPRTIARATRSD
ncbi:MAG: NAD(P)-dependent glycerol-3-phosphate dehydrogenase [Myxococcota bacterium]|nr:NAD(P)-dependent glycerol-3-phosphate dehydrogenase [Myxococcota bacterium]